LIVFLFFGSPQCIDSIGIYRMSAVFKLDTAGQETVLYSFPAAADGDLPHAGLIGDAEGNLYGTTFGGGTKNGGVVFKLKGAAGPVTGMLWRR
jgi:uncharacterized repeat protein (TIGR03803 family)